MATDDTHNGTSKRALIEVSPDMAARFGDPRLPLALVAAVVGAVALLIGYFGVSGTLDPAKQLPYLISGGVGGLFLLGVAAALLFSADLGATRADIGRLSEQVRELSDQVAELQASLEDQAPRPRARSTSSSSARQRS
jgi:outer membrane murein-binding lipoprotein Lpp